jgi:K+-sensing histidine kinase KdpD
VLINILDNACKFTPKHGLIQVTGAPYFWERRTAGSVAPQERRRASLRTPNSYRVDIRNSGPLIPVEHMTRIFEEYTSYAGGRDRSGGGLGLAICRMIISEHDGMVWAENNDAGPMITFVIPLRSEAGRTGTQTGTVALAEAG